jgi:AcrR family transcriptional regulator
MAKAGAPDEHGTPHRTAACAVGAPTSETVSSKSTTPAPDRHARRRERTRTRLLEASKTLFARQGVESTRINEITEEADVGFGSFYNHFENKEAIVAEVFTETVSAHAATVDALTAQLEDPAEVIAAAHRYFVRLADSDPEWAWLLVRLEASHGVMRASLGEHAIRDLHRGIESGRLSVRNERMALVACGGALLRVMRTVLDGDAPRDADIYHAEGVLRLLGLPAEEAAQVARRPLSDEAGSTS